MEAAGGADEELVAAAAELQAWQAFFDTSQYGPTATLCAGLNRVWLACKSCQERLTLLTTAIPDKAAAQLEPGHWCRKAVLACAIDNTQALLCRSLGAC